MSYTVFGTSKRITILISISFMLILLGLSLISGAIAELKPQKINTNITLPQTSDSATYQNISSILLANGTLLFLDAEMTKNGYDFYYILDSSYVTSLGRYCVNGYGDDIDDTTWRYCFEVTSTGKENLTTFLFIFLSIIAGVFLLGVSLRDNWIMMLASILTLFFGFFVIIYGIDIFKDTTTTWAIGIIVWGLSIIGIFKSAQGQLADGGWS